MHDNSMKLMAYFRDKYLLELMGCTILDVGARKVKRRHRCYRELFKLDYGYFGMDIVPGRNVDIVGYEAIGDRVFDVVISGQTMEHINRPWEWLKMLKQYFAKYICIIAPNKFSEHRYPIDTYRYFPDGMRDLFECAGVIPLEIFKDKADTIGIGTK